MGNGLIVSIDKEVPTILDINGESFEILEQNPFHGKTTIQIKASKSVGITGAHLLQKCYWEREKLELELSVLKLENEFLINQRINNKNS